jgi:transketolase
MKNEHIRCLEHVAYNLRVDCLRATTQAGSGHITSCLSSADIMAVIFFNSMHFDVNDFKNRCNDRFILSKGHAAPLLYAVWKELGKISEDELLTLRQFDSPLEGHPTPRFIYNEVATGSLGQGLSMGCGMALAAHADNLSYTTYVLLGDSEMTEGSNWEAAEVASYYKLNNLVAVVDVNRLGQSTATIEGHDLERYVKKFEAFGWRALTVDGHDSAALVHVFDEAKTITDKPTVIIAKTLKGYGLDADVENHEGFHGKAMPPEKLDFFLEKLRERFLSLVPFDTIPRDAAESLRTSDSHRVGFTTKGEACCSARGECSECDEERIEPYELKKDTDGIRVMDLPTYTTGEKIATRYAYGQALVALGKADADVVALDAEVKNSTYSELFEQKFPHRFYQCFIAEQNMIGMGVGMQVRGKVPFISTFAAFLTRAHDQIRMAAIGQSALRICGSHAGVSIGEDGPSQMGLEDIALMRALPESIVLYPCDAVSTYKSIELMAKYTQGISYIRTTRGATPVLYKNNETFVIGGCKQLTWSVQDQVCIVAAGITVFEALKAHEQLLKENISIRVIDCYSVKPLPVKDLLAAAQACGNRMVTVEDHYPEGGLGEAVCAALIGNSIKITCLAVKKLPRSGKSEQLLAYEDIDAAAIAAAVRSFFTAS